MKTKEADLINETDWENESTLHSLLHYFSGRPAFAIAAKAAQQCCNSIHDSVRRHQEEIANEVAPPHVIDVIVGMRSKNPLTRPESIMGYCWWLVVSHKANVETIQVETFTIIGDSCTRVAHCHPVIDAGADLAKALNVPKGTLVCGVRWWGERVWA